MLKQLITAFVGANVISEGASYLLGEGNPIAQGVQAVTSGSFLSGTGQPSTTSFQTNNLRSKSMDEKLDIKLSGASTQAHTSAISPETKAATFPLGYRNEIKINPQIRRLLDDVAHNRLVQNQNLDINSLYTSPEDKIQVC